MFEKMALGLEDIQKFITAHPEVIGGGAGALTGGLLTRSLLGAGLGGLAGAGAGYASTDRGRQAIQRLLGLETPEVPSTPAAASEQSQVEALSEAFGLSDVVPESEQLAAYLDQIKDTNPDAYYSTLLALKAKQQGEFVKRKAFLEEGLKKLAPNAPIEQFQKAIIHPTLVQSYYSGLTKSPSGQLLPTFEFPKGEMAGSPELQGLYRGISDELAASMLEPVLAEREWTANVEKFAPKWRSVFGENIPRWANVSLWEGLHKTDPGRAGTKKTLQYMPWTGGEKLYWKNLQKYFPMSRGGPPDLNIARQQQAILQGLLKEKDPQKLMVELGKTSFGKPVLARMREVIQDPQNPYRITAAPQQLMKHLQKTYIKDYGTDPSSMLGEELGIPLGAGLINALRNQSAKTVGSSLAARARAFGRGFREFTTGGKGGLGTKGFAPWALAAFLLGRGINRGAGAKDITQKIWSKGVSRPFK